MLMSKNPESNAGNLENNRSVNRMKKENEFYLRDTRTNVGSSCTFWCKNGMGYASDLDKAEIFNFERAQEHASRGGHFVPLSKSVVDIVSELHVDMQYLKLSTDFSKGVVIQQGLGSYDGNDIYFFNGSGRPSSNYSQAKVFTLEEAGTLDINGAIHSKRFIDSISRRVIKAYDINMRKMVTNAGIKYRKQRKRMTTGKTRGNCPTCGKITWGFNPYENEYCDDHGDF
jgi:hypothetical protein